MKAKACAITLEVAVVQPAPPFRSSGSMSGSAPTSTEEPGKRSTSASMFAKAPAESFMPVNTPGNAARGRSINAKGIGTAETCGTRYSTVLSRGSAMPSHPSASGGWQCSANGPRSGVRPACGGAG